jgi:hypothetical protein
VTAGARVSSDRAGPNGAHTPVIIIIYNRPEMTHQLIDALREVQPTRLLVVADGPKDSGGHDFQAVEGARKELDSIDWKCEVETNMAPKNLGCTTRVASGLDWAFERIDRAIILEDDINPTPEFFGWASSVLKLYEQRDDIAMVCGHNPLVRWSEYEPESAVVPSRRGSVWGWATTAQKWQAVRQFDLKSHVGRGEKGLSENGFEPFLAGLYGSYLRQAAKGQLSWDVHWTLRMALSNRMSLVSPVNFIHHLGVGPLATHHKESDDTLLVLPRPMFNAPARWSLSSPGSTDQLFDRLSVLLYLLDRTKNPRVAARLSRSHSLPVGEDYRAHLLPFVRREDSVQALSHLVDHGVDPRRIKHWMDALHLGSAGGH